MSANKDNDENFSITDKTFTSEMGIHSTQVSQTGESSATESVELNAIQATPISTRYENKTDEIAAMMQLLLKIYTCLLYTSRCV